MNDRIGARELLACLGDASRYRIARELSQGHLCVSDLALRVGLSQSCTTRHLQALERVGFAARRRDGKRVLYQLRSDDADVRSFLLWLESAEVGVPRRGSLTSRSSRERRSAAASEPGANRARAAGAQSSPLEPADDPVQPQDTPNAVSRPLRRGDMDDFLL
ncbi:MAG: winged helix-turn-helix transcriptional regulator [Candidatus Eisenbacteria bacterium]|uniref:Winged helix-turn-helix transcriptional regulator n=1 Tax=Eiseniibacteriota bacterium TaxID=2212470 RepID=A0A849SQG1_UNCEI|nr:winged helix-turn-helix transcriptional regulator [Candidatus Eisenbacteria bacterium]